MDHPHDSEAFAEPCDSRTLASFRLEGFVFGRFGLRAGWGIIAFVAIWFVASVIASVFALGATGQMASITKSRMEAQAHAGTPHQAVHILFTPLYVTVNDGITLAVMVAAAWLFSRGERRRFAAYGIGPHRRMDFFPGAIWGLLLMSALVWTLHALHVLVFDGRALTLGPAILYGCKWFVAFLLVGGAEEYFFRGYIQYTLMRGVWGLAERISRSNPRPYAFWIAATTLSLAFALTHLGNSGETHFGIAVVFLAGITFAYALWRTGSLWWGIGFHAAWDWAQSFLFGVPDSGNISVGRLFLTHPAGKPLLSGGSDGPEGSVLVVAALLLAIVAIRLMPAGEQPSMEQMTPIDAQETHALIS